VLLLLLVQCFLGGVPSFGTLFEVAESSAMRESLIIKFSLCDGLLSSDGYISAFVETETPS
jgi:hypothetical protein